MRWIFLSLLAANVGLGVWLWQQSQTDAKVQVQPGYEVVSPDAKSIVLLGEHRLAKKEPVLSSAPRISMEEVSAGNREGRAVCTLVGPLSAEIDGQTLVDRLAAVEVIAQIREFELPGQVAYWLYLSPEISKKEALRKLHTLQAEGIDSYIIPKGELENGISLGMFSDETSALDQQEALQARKYNVLMRETERTYHETWLVITAQEAEKMSISLWDGLLKDRPELSRRQNFCPGVAS